MNPKRILSGVLLTTLFVSSAMAKSIECTIMDKFAVEVPEKIMISKKGEKEIEFNGVMLRATFDQYQDNLVTISFGRDNHAYFVKTNMNSSARLSFGGGDLGDDLGLGSSGINGYCDLR